MARHGLLVTAQTIRQNTTTNRLQHSEKPQKGLCAALSTGVARNGLPDDKEEKENEDIDHEAYHQSDERPDET